MVEHSCGYCGSLLIFVGSYLVTCGNQTCPEYGYEYDIAETLESWDHLDSHEQILSFPQE